METSECLLRVTEVVQAVGGRSTAQAAYSFTGDHRKLLKDVRRGTDELNHRHEKIRRGREGQGQEIADRAPVIGVAEGEGKEKTRSPPPGKAERTPKAKGEIR